MGLEPEQSSPHPQKIWRRIIFNGVHCSSANENNFEVLFYLSHKGKDQKYNQQQMLEGVWKKESLYPLLVSYQTGASTMEIIVDGY